VHPFREKERRHVEENVARLSRVGQRIWTCPREAGQTVEIGAEKAFHPGRPLSSISYRVDFAKKNLAQIIGISSEIGGVGTLEDSCLIA
jgi:hypothetical protein